MSFLFDYAAEVREMLVSMEIDVGLDDLSDKERDVLYAFRRLMDASVPVRSDALRAHPLVERMTHPTYHRALRSLMEKEFISHAPQTFARTYVAGPALSRCE